MVPPLSGIILCDYFLVNKGNYAAYEKAVFHKWNPIPWITWAISIVLVYLIPYGLPSLNGIIIGGAIYTVLMLVTKKQVVVSEK